MKLLKVWVLFMLNHHLDAQLDPQTIFNGLRVPFARNLVRFRAGATNGDKRKNIPATRAMALAYVESKHYRQRLDELLGLNWSMDLKAWGENKVICALTICGITRSSSGEASKDEGFGIAPTAEAQAFKRACTAFGLGAELYDYPSVWVEYDNQKKRLVWGKTPKPYIDATRTIEVQQVITRPLAKQQSNDVSISQKDAAELHKYLGKTYGEYVKSSEHKYLASLALGEEITSFMQLTRADSKLVIEQIRETAIERKAEKDAKVLAVIDASDDKAREVLGY